MSDQEILQSYRSLSTIQNCFRVLKTNFDARPISVWTTLHIEAHFLIYFVSLVVIRIIEKPIKFSVNPGSFDLGKMLFVRPRILGSFWQHEFSAVE